MANSDNKKTLKMIEKIVNDYANDRQKLLSELRDLIKEGKRSGDLFLVGASYYYVAKNAYDVGDRDELLVNALKAVALLKDSDEYKIKTKAYVALGYAYFEKVDFQMALEWYDKALRIANANKIKGEIKTTLLNDLASCYHSLGDCKKSIKLLSECIKQTKLIDPIDYTSLAMYTLNFAENHKDLGKLEEAKAILQSMNEWIGEISFKPIVCDYYLRSSIVYHMLGDIDRGNECFDMAISMVPKDMYPHPIYEDLNIISCCLVKNLDKTRSKKVIDLMEVYSKKNKGTIEQIYAYKTMSNYYQYFGDKDYALVCFNKLEELYERRIKELEISQLSVHKKMQAANNEMQKLKMMLKKNDEINSLEPLTNLLNRSALLRVSSEFIERALKKKKKVGAIFIDIDFFKECNDTYGHSVGDEIIKKVADACKVEEKSNIQFARYGGDEFFGITMGLEDEEVNEIARRICQRIKEEAIPNAKNPNGHIITLSVGVANVAVTSQTDTIIEIANYADKAVYHAKGAGKNKIYMLKYSVDDSKYQYSRYIEIKF